MRRQDNIWAATEAKARFSELIRRAENDGPQTVTRSGKATVMVVSTAEWRKRRPDRAPKRAGESLAAFLGRSPLRGSGMIIERAKDRPRDLKL